MHARQHVRLAALIASHGPVFEKPNVRFSSASLTQYWTAAKRRLDAWEKAFGQLEHEAQRGADAPGPAAADEQHDNEVSMRPVVEEVLLSEVLTRVWTAACQQYDEGARDELVAPIARSVFLGHQEARRLALTVLVGSLGVTPREVRRLNVLRQKCERWTDLFLAQLVRHPAAGELAFDVARLTEFAEQVTQESDAGLSAAASSLTTASLQAALQRGITEEVPNPKLNEQIAGGVLACLPGHFVDSTGPLGSLWAIRIEHTTSDTQGMVDDLLSLG